MIIHKKDVQVTRYSGYLIGFSEEKKECYICNYEVKANPKKLTDDWDKVTCKNCLKIRKSNIKRIEKELKEVWGVNLYNKKYVEPLENSKEIEK